MGFTYIFLLYTIGKPILGGVKDVDKYDISSEQKKNLDIFQKKCNESIQ